MKIFLIYIGRGRTHREQVLITCVLTLVVFVVVEERLEAVEEKLGSYLGSVVFLKRG